MTLTMTPLQRFLYMIEGLFIDHTKTRAIHDMKNEVTSVTLGIQSVARLQERAVKKTTAYKVAHATGALR